MDHALDQGINFFDTANVYGGIKGEGVTEQIVGRWLAQGDGRRERIVLATKVYGHMGDGPNDYGLSAYHIKRACEGSLQRLQTDHIDLYQMHHVDRQTPWEEIWQAMEQLITEGKILYVGSSNFGGLHIALANLSAQRRNTLGLVAEQSLYNLAHRMIELEVIPACKEFGMGIIPWSPLAGGLLGGMTDKRGSDRRKEKWVQDALQKNKNKVDAYESLCHNLDMHPAQLALAWLLYNPVVAAPIIGPRTMEQLEDAAAATKIKVTAEIAKQLDEIWPGPGGEAPEAYAW